MFRFLIAYCLLMLGSAVASPLVRIHTALGVIEAELAALKELRRDIASEAHSRLQRGQPVTRAQAAAYLGVSTKKLQRMEAGHKIERCRDLGSVVLYPARDVLRLASASAPKGA